MDGLFSEMKFLIFLCFNLWSTIHNPLMTFCDGRIIVKDVNFTYSKTSVFGNISVFTPINSSSFINVSVITFEVAHTLEIFAQLSVPDSKDDDEFRRVLVRARFDIAKVLEKDVSFFLRKPILDAFLKSLTFELKFPLPKVR